MISGILTAVLMTAFLAVVGWAWSARNRERFEQAALLPLRDGEPGEHATQTTSACSGTCCCGKENEA